MINKNEHLTRQFDLIPEEVMGLPITIIGAGAIGGWTALSLAKMGFLNLSVIDFDTIEIENMNSQFYRMKDIGKKKVLALQELIQEFTDFKIHVTNDRYIKSQHKGITICAVDSMDVRKEAWLAHKKFFASELFIDPRMGAETALLYAMDPNNEKDIVAYEKTLYSDDEAIQERCTAKATIYTANLLAGMVVKTVKDYAVKKEYPRTLTWDISQDQFQCWRKTNV